MIFDIQKIMLINFDHVDGGTALAFKPDDETEYLIGTEEGMVYLCSTEYGSQYIRSISFFDIMDIHHSKSNFHGGPHPNKTR